MRCALGIHRGFGNFLGLSIPPSVSMGGYGHMTTICAEYDQFDFGTSGASRTSVGQVKIVKYDAFIHF
jgi:hypothetical protein